MFRSVFNTSIVHIAQRVGKSDLMFDCVLIRCFQQLLTQLDQVMSDVQINRRSLFDRQHVATYRRSQASRSSIEQNELKSN